MKRPGRKHLPIEKLPSVIRRGKAALFRNALLRWYDVNARDFPWRRRGVSIYKLVLAEVLLQRTRAETVAVFFDRFVTRFPTWQSIANASEQELGQLLKPIGLWRRRAASLRRLAGEMVTRRGEFPRRRSQVESLPGVGQYIANSILLFSAGRPEPLLDVNMARVLERYFGPRKLVDIRYDPYLQELSRSVVRGRRSRDINWAILDLAAIVCRVKRPRCAVCPLRAACKYRRSVASFSE